MAVISSNLKAINEAKVAMAMYDYIKIENCKRLLTKGRIMEVAEISVTNSL